MPDQASIVRLSDCKLAYHWQPCTVQAENVLLFLHGWGCDHAIFNAFSGVMARKWSVLSVDFPGHGESDEPPIPWGVQDYADQIQALLTHLNITKVCVVAHSFGARVAIRLAASHPMLIEKLLMTGGAGIRPTASARKSKRQKQYQLLKKAALSIGKIPFLKATSESWMEKLVQRFGSPDYARLNPEMRKTFVRVINEDLSPLLKDISCPTLLIWGEKDTETPLWMGQQMEKEIPDAGLVVFEERGHFAFVEEPQRFLTIMKSFFEGSSNIE